MKARVAVRWLLVLLFTVAVATAVTDEPDNRVQVFSSEVQGTAKEVKWLGRTHEIVIAVTKPKGWIFRSVDEGKNWKKLGPNKENGVHSIAHSEADPMRFMLIGEGDDKGVSTHWISSDGGEQFYKTHTEFILRGVKFHPKVGDWALGYKQNMECAKTNDGGQCFGNLLLSKNGGGTWTEIAKNIKYPNYDWAQAVDPKRSDPKAIFVIQHEKDQAEVSGWNPELNFVFSTTFFDTSETALDKGNNFAIVGKYLFVARAMSHEHVALWVSTDGGRSFDRATLDVESIMDEDGDLKERGYDLMEGLEDSVFASVRAGDVEVKYASLYQSDRSALLWTKSLDSVHHPHGGSAAIAKVKGIDGIYLANQVLNPKASAVEEIQLRSVVSFDDGGKWLPLLPPDVDSEGKEYPCKKPDGRGCALHLFFRGNALGYAPLYSTAKATGLMLATGFVGPFAASEGDAETHGVGTFLSRDGGWTWKEIRKGGHTYEFGDHGAIMVLTKHRVPTDEVLYTWDEGATFETVKLPKTMKVENIIIQPNSTSTHFLLIGNSATDDVDAEIVVVDFGSLHTRVCTGENEAGKKDSDYEMWNPRLPLKFFEGSAQGKTDCLLGRKIKYTRRKRLSKCFNGQERERMEVVKTCQCTKGDYECDLHYYKSAEGKEAVCAWDPAQGAISSAVEDEDEEEVFGADMARLYTGDLKLDDACRKYQGRTTLEVPSGYRKIPGNKCVGGVNLGSQTMQCGAAAEEEDAVPVGTETSEEIDAQTGGLKEAKTSTSKVDRMPKELVYLKPEGKIVFSISQYTGVLYRSEDFGATWKVQSSKLLEFNSPDDSITSVHVHPVAPDLVMFVGTDKMNWLTDDGGESYSAVKPGFSMGKGGLKWHPQDMNKGLAYKEDPSCLEQRSVRCYGELMLTEDQGKTFRSIAANVKWPNYAWAVEAWPKMEADAIFAVQHSEKTGDVSWDPGLSLVLSSDLFATQKALRSGNNFVIMGKYVFVATAKSTTEVGLWVSRGGKFHQAKLPVGLAERGYGLLHTHENSVFLSVRNGDVGTKWGDLLTSDATGTSWVASLHGVAHESGRVTEIAKVHGTDGVYLANKVINEESASQGGEVQLQTVVTFDKGRSWQQLMPPAQDSHAQLYSCEGMGVELCGLHLFFDGNTMGVPPVYTNDNATGLIWAIGYVGAYVTNEVLPEQLGTFFSRDAGYTWAELKKGAYIVEFGDHGGIMVAAPDRVMTEKLIYSWDEGATWQTIKVDKMMVKAISVFDGQLSQRFVIYGRGADSNGGIIVHVDFETLHKRSCVGESRPGTEGSDYELWAPRSSVHSECILGHKDLYARRKPAARCFNKKTYEKLVQHHNCRCDAHDFECDYGFESDTHGQCINAAAMQATEKERDLSLLYRNRELLDDLCLKYPDQTTFVAHSGFRKIPGDSCIGGINRESLTLECPEGLSELGAVKTTNLVVKNVKASVSPVDEDVKDMRWIGEDKQTILMVSKVRGTLYRSLDEGATWTRESGKMEGSMDLLASGESTSGVATIVPLPGAPDCALLIGLGKAHWTTCDKGETYTHVVTDFHVDANVLPHPTDQARALSYAHNHECLATKQHHCFGSLLLTTDGGATWNKVAEKVKYPNYAWSQSGKAILLVQHAEVDRKSKSTRWDPELQLVRTKDGCKTLSTVVSGGNNFAVVGPYVFVAKAESPTDVSLWVSKNEGASFTKATFPAQLAQRSYGIMDTSGSGAVFASVRDGDPDVQFSSLYLSDTNGEVWSLSMKHTHHERGFGVDLSKFHGLEGIYLANQVLNADATRQKAPPELQTVVTFDAGAEWFPIKGPQVDCQGNPYKCGGDKSCRLNLFFRHNKQGVYGVYAPENAAGVALATGYMGPAGGINDVGPDEMGLFLSRDAGRTWLEIRKGAYTYEVGDHGAILIIAKHRVVTDVVHYSWDEGKTWEDIAIPPMEVTNIVTEPQSTSQRFVVMGKAHKGADTQVSLNNANLVFLDLSGLHQKKCEGMDKPGTPESDFELWSPTPHAGVDKCQMGTKVSYVRRKRGHKCFNGVEHEGRQETQVCECTYADYVCSYGYERKGEDCIHQKNFLKDPEEESLAEDLYELYKNRGLHQTVCAKHPKQTELVLVSGYQLVPGTKCKGGLQFENAKLLCEQNMSVEEEVEHHWGWTLIAVGVGVLLCLLLVLYLKLRSAGEGADYARVSTREGQELGVQVFGEMDPEMDDEYGEDELMAEGVLSPDDMDREDGRGGWGGMNPKQMRHNSRGGSY